MYAITSKIGNPDMMAIVGPDGRLDFPAADGPLLASMLDDAFPACTACEDRDGVCEHCGTCPECGACDSCRPCDGCGELEADCTCDDEDADPEDQEF